MLPGKCKCGKGCAGKYANNVTYLRDSPALNLPYIPLREGVSSLVFPGLSYDDAASIYFPLQIVGIFKNIRLSIQTPNSNLPSKRDACNKNFSFFISQHPCRKG